MSINYTKSKKDWADPLRPSFNALWLILAALLIITTVTVTFTFIIHNEQQIKVKCAAHNGQIYTGAARVCIVNPVIIPLDQL